ncbi:polyprenyl-phosphate transporter [Alistipes timonensis]
MKFSRYIILALKGCAMGMADVVPGVSGGTIAFISGIYEELLDSIRSVNATALKLLLRFRFAEFWRHINGRFLLPVLLGIAVAIFSLARLMTYLLVNHPIAIWSFFFGLIVASALLVARQIGRWDWRTLLAFVVGAVAAWWITVATPAETPNDWWFVMLSGAIAICAMILPGISGAFILLLLGKYQYIMHAVGEFNIPVIVVFVIGAAAGIISFSHLLSWLLKHWHDVTVAVLMGFMVGSLNKVWPWKETVETYLDSHGVAQPLVQTNIAPGTFEQLTGQPSLLMQAILLGIVGFMAIYGIELAARIIVKKQEE